MSILPKIILALALLGAVQAKAETAIGLGISTSTGLSIYTDTQQGYFIQSLLGITEPMTFSVDACYAKTLQNQIKGFLGGGMYLRNHYYHRRHYYYYYEEGLNVGLEIPMGIIVHLPPVQVSVELAPSINIAPYSYSYLDLTLAIRYIL